MTEMFEEERVVWSRARMEAVLVASKQRQGDWRKQWVAEKLNRMGRLWGETSVDHDSALTLIARSVFNALAAEIWPVRRKERQRFVQLLVTFAAPFLGARTISVPLLSTYFTQQGWSQEADELRQRWQPHSHRLTLLGVEVDMTEEELSERYPQVTTSVLRQFSYANLLYDALCDYQLQAYVWSAHGLSSSEVGYVRQHNEDGHWRIHFGMDWLLALMTNTEELSRHVLPRRAPAEWWLSRCSIGRSKHR